MRTFNFKARNIGQEKYLTYTMGEECELDEDVLDYCEENSLEELVEIIYEEDDDYDYLTYNITDRISLDEYTQNEMNSRKVLYILRNVAKNLISLKEQAITLSYILLNKSFMYIDEETLDIKFICLPIESKASVITEFKSFMRQLIANMTFDVEEELSYVGKLLTYINGSSFNLRGLIGLAEALMEEAGISYEETSDIDADGVEVVSSETPVEESVSDFMNSAEDEALPEIGDDMDEEEEPVVEADEELDSILPTGMKLAETPVKETQVEEAPVEEAPEEIAPVDIKEEETVAEASVAEQPAEQVVMTEQPVAEKMEDKTIPVAEKTKETDVDIIKSKIRQLAGQVPTAKTTGEGKQINTIDDLDAFLESKPPVVKKNVVKVNRAALIQNAAAELEETAELTSDKAPVMFKANEEVQEDMSGEKPKSNSVLSKNVDDTVKKTNLINPPKATPYLIRVNTEEKIMLSKITFKLGKATRGVDYTVSGNGAISRQHAVILQKDGVCYIKDNKSTNHTYVNGKMVDDGVEEILTHDSMIRLGDEEFLFKIR